jgi:hypothetical protein
MHAVRRGAQLTPTEVSPTATFELAKSRRPSGGLSMLPENAFRQRGVKYERAGRADGPFI